MTFDDSYKKIIEMQEALRRAADPLADLYRKVDLMIDAHHLPKVDEVTMQVLRGAYERQRLLGLVTDTHFSGIDRLGLFKLADQVNACRNLFGGPIEEHRRLELLGAASSLKSRLDGALSSYENYEHLFRLPATMEASRLANEVLAAVSPAVRLYGYGFGQPSSVLETAMASMHAPWLNRNHVFQSAHSFAEIQAIGHAINFQRPYDPGLTNVLRRALGDWRDLTSFPAPIFENPLVRSDFYIDLGFDAALTDFTAQAFDESTGLAGLWPQSDETTNEAEEEVGLQRNSAAYKQLLRFERQLRRFIDRLMADAFGQDWIKHHTPAGMMDDWKRKRAEALAKGESEQPLISYADFSDYLKIIERNDNWTCAFEDIFDRKDDVRESFVRLYPVRICTMHARVITLDDELLLRVETRRILRAISKRELH